MKKNLLTLMMILTLPFLGMSQTTLITGLVTGENGPIANTDVHVFNSPSGTSPGDTIQTTQTGPTGQFYFVYNTFDVTDIIGVGAAACPENVSYIFSQSNEASDSLFVVLSCGEDTTGNGFEALFIGASPLNDTGSEWFFTSSVFGEVETYSWSIEGETYTTADVTHAFSQSGGQDVTLTTQMVSGNELTASTYVYVQDSLFCEAFFYPMVDSSSADGIVFVNASFGDDLSYYWNFGDGNTSEEAYPTYQFTDSMEYEVCLTVFTTSCQNTFCMIISPELFEDWNGAGINGIVSETGGTVKVPGSGTSSEAKSTGFEFKVVPINNGTLGTTLLDLSVDLGLYPNPSSGNFTLNLATDYPETGQITVYDVSGRSVHQQVGTLSQGENVFYLSLNELPDGVYVISFNGTMNVGAQKLVIRR
jgi:PKD repeat protein